MYDYYESMKEDILYYLQNETNERNFDNLYDDLFINDSVTGNASGSYTFNTWKARQYVNDNHDLLQNALNDFCVSREEIAEHFLNDDFEYFDVTIRCYILGQVLQSVLDELEKEEEEEEEEEEF